jgi:midasin
MCLNEKLTFNIKIKSRNCELFVLKKNDFLRLSVNFKEFIENFLHKSLMIYLKFNEEKKKIMREEESKIKKNEEGQKAEGDKQDLEVVDEEGEEDVSEYDINSEFDSESKSESTDQEEDEKDKTNLSRANSNIKNADGSGQKKEKSEGEKSDEEKNQEDKDKDGMNLNDTIESEEDDPIDKMKNQINKKFIKKIDKILDYLDKNNINFNNVENNPKVLLKQLKSEVNILEKNHIIDKIETILKDFYKDQSYSRDGN